MTVLFFLGVICFLEGIQSFVSNYHPTERFVPSKVRAVSLKNLNPSKCIHIDVDPSGDDSWKLAEVVNKLDDGDLGILPTDTCYVFCCSINSRRGVDRIFHLKEYVGKRKPLSLLCKDISAISKHSDGIDKDLFKIMKKVLPGPFTFIVTATHQVPRILIDHKKHKKTWKRREIGVRIPDQPVLRYVLDRVSSPLICSSVPLGDSNDDAEDGNEDWSQTALAQLERDPQHIVDSWSHAVDFIVNAGVIPNDGVTTVVNCVAPSPEIVRCGMGDPSLLNL